MEYPTSDIDLGEPDDSGGYDPDDYQGEIRQALRKAVEEFQADFTQSEITEAAEATRFLYVVEESQNTALITCDSWLDGSRVKYQIRVLT